MRPPTRVRSIFAAAALLYLFAILQASASPGPRAWGLHLTGFLDPPIRILVITVLGAGVAASVMLLLAPLARAPQGRGATEPVRTANGVPLGYQIAFLAAYGTLLWCLRTRTHFLGDGQLWLTGLREGSLPASPEALAQATWLAASGLLRSLGAPLATLALVSIACGLAAAALLWRIAREIMRGEGGFITAFLLLLTLGITQLFFGYIESYPVAIVAILAYMLAGLRYANRGKGVALLILSFGIAVSVHLVSLYLTPSLVFLIWRERQSRLRRAALVGLALALPISGLLLLGNGPREWFHTFDVAVRGVRETLAAASMRAYEVVSIDHSVDLVNELLLVIPVPLLLLLTAFGSGGLGNLRTDPAGAFLAIAAAFGLAGACTLVLPLAPAQDWDLMSTLLLPLGILGVWAGGPLYASGGRLFRVAAVSIGLGSLLSFVLVNASPRAGTKRYETLVAPGARISGYARRYAYESLIHAYRLQRDYRGAMTYAQLLLRLAPSEPRYWGMAGETLTKEGDYQRAIPFLRESLRLNPNRATARTNLGICYSALNRYPEALDEFSTAVRLDPDRPDYRHNLGLALLNAGMPDSAFATWNEVLRRWPKYGPTVRAVTRRGGMLTQ